MEFIVDRKKFLKAISFCTSVIEKKSTTPLLEHVVIKAENNNISLKATDLDLLIEESFEANVISKGILCIPIVITYDILKRLGEFEDIKFHRQEDAQITITSNNAEFKIPVIEASEFPDISKTELTCNFDINKNDLKKLIDDTYSCMGEEEVRTNINGIYLHMNDTLKSVSTDLHRIAQSKVKQKINNFPEMIIGRKTVYELKKLLDSTIDSLKIGASDSRIQFNIETEGISIMFSSRLINGKFPDYQQVFNENLDKKIMFDKRQIEKILDRMTLFVDNEKSAVQFKLLKNKLIIEASSKKLGSAKEELDIDYSQNEFSIKFNIFYVLDVIKNLNCLNVEFLMKSQYDSILIKAENEDNAQYIIMPLVA